MSKDQLFLMQPGFFAAESGPLYCGDSVSVEGLLGFFPDLRSAIDVEYVAFERPRGPIPELIGEENQSIPVLILDPSEGMAVQGSKSANGRHFIDDEKRIRDYLCAKFDLPSAG